MPHRLVARTRVALVAKPVFTCGSWGRRLRSADNLEWNPIHVGRWPWWMGMAVVHWFERVVVVKVRDEDDEVVPLVSLAGHDQATALQPGDGGADRLALWDIGRVIGRSKVLCPGLRSKIDDPGEPHFHGERAPLPCDGHRLGIDKVVDLGGGCFGCERAVEGFRTGPVPPSAPLVGSHDRRGVHDLSPYGPFDPTYFAGFQRIKQVWIEGSRERHQM